MDDLSEQQEFSESFQPSPPSFLVNICDQVTEFIVTYGWYFLIIGLVIIFYWDRIRNYLDERYREQSEKEYEAKCKKDPDWLQQRQREMEVARKRMQEELDRKAAEHAAKMKEKEEQKRAALLESSREGGQRLGYGEATTAVNASQTKSSTTKPYRPEYNPLMGSGGSGGYRPPRRGCPGGGCG
ncbi:selenoprotein S-like [Macrosteles quadrilineatus]|uniref:selenoprotein S-like n=1 Tax=Macrosteles quadrilineatus TaxID=74068 RepID=UPI0023E2CBC8|nr:selenoprotein S-like [Macrosteles quadrilineatus]